MADANQLASLKMSTTTTLKASDIRIHDFQIDGKSTPLLGDDLVERVSQAARQAAQSRPQTGLRLGAIDVDFDGTVLWNGIIIPNREELEVRLAAAVAQPIQPEVHLRPNKLVLYKSVAMVMASAQRLGITKMGIVGNEQFVK